jgi:arsenite/tail-anchored protein-transporting ATPase
LAGTSTRSRPLFHLYCGKGGVGKTTLAAAAARQAALRGRRVLIVSTDPAHSLGDALGQRLTARPRRLPVPRDGSGRRRRSRGRLEAAELAPARALAEWLGRPGRPGERVAGRRAAFERLLLRGTLLDREDIARLLQLSLPGLDELVALIEIERLAEASSADLVVVDTAPTGHTWRLLDGPDTIAAVARVLDTLLAHDREVAAAIGGRAPRDAADALVEELTADARRLAARLKDPRATRVTWITLAEPVAVAEAVDAVAWLRDRHLPLAQVVVNRAAVENRSCRVCRARAAVGRASLAPLRKAARGVPFRFVADRPAARATSRSMWKAGGRRPKQMSVATDGLKLLVVAGKGGVGKTTVAAALAIEAARKAPGRRVLLLSTDPAHSLGDVLGLRLGDRPRRVAGAGALEAREIDAAAALEREREGLRRAVDETFGEPAARSTMRGSGLRIDLAQDRDAALRLLDLSPPGLDEILGLASIIAALDRYDLIVVDTAPTGHALRLLAMPEVAGAWLAELMRLLLKYRDLTRIGPLGERVVRLSRDVRGLDALLRDRSRTRAVVVTRAAELPRLETGRLLDALDGRGISTAAVIINAVTPSTASCPRCRAVRRTEASEIALLARRTVRRPGARRAARPRRLRPDGCDIIVAPLSLPPPRGVARLAAWMRRWTDG